MSHSKIRQSVINAFLEHKECTISELTHYTGFSRVSISHEIEELSNRDVVKKKDKSRVYYLSGNTAFVIFKLHEKCAETVCVSADQKLFERYSSGFLYSLSYSENVTFLSANVQKRASVLKKSFEKVFLCVIYDKEIDLSRIISRQFEIRKSRHDLVTRGTERLFGKDTVSYIDADTHFSCLSSGGIALGLPRALDQELSELFPSAFSLFAPNRLFIDTSSKESTKNNIPSFPDISFFVCDSLLKLDEKQMIVDILCK